MQHCAALFPRDLDFAGSVRVSMLGRVGNKLVDKEAKGNRLVRRNHQAAEFAMEFVLGRGFLQFMAKLAGKVRDIDESDLLAAPKMIVHLRDRGDA
jgi:hypothetical protein